jgi:hypothetical protein
VRKRPSNQRVTRLLRGRALNRNAGDRHRHRSGGGARRENGERRMNNGLCDAD